MSQENENLSGSPTMHPSYLVRLDDLLLNGRECLPLLDALADEFGNDPKAKSLRHLSQSLRNNCSAETVVHDPSLLYWLPWIVTQSPAGAAGQERQELQRVRLLERLAVKKSYLQVPWRSLLYPTVLILLAVIVFVLLSLKIVPIFATMFREFELQLPTPTKIVFGLADTLQSRPLTFLIGVSLLVAATLGVVRWLPDLLDRLSKWSIVGYWTAGSNRHLDGMASFLETLAAMVSLDAPKEEALKVAARACNNKTISYYANSLAMELQHRPNNDGSIGTPKQTQSKVAHNFPQLMIVALETGSELQSRSTVDQVELFRRLAYCYRVRVQQRFRWFSTFLGPIAIILIGSMIGFVIIAMFLPLIKLVTSLS